MTPLRQRMIQDLQLRGYSDRTVQAYVRSVAQLSNFYGTSPDRIVEEQVREYLLHLTNVQKVARGTHTIALCGIKFFYERTLGRTWPVLDVCPPQGREEAPRCAEPRGGLAGARHGETPAAAAVSERTNPPPLD